MMTDQDLLKRIGAGEEEAFGEIYQRYQSSIFRFAWHMIGSAAAAEDVTQEVFMTLLRPSEKFDPSRGPFSAYLFGIARHQVFRYLNRERHISMQDQPDKLIDPVDLSTPFSDLARGRIIDAVRSAILTLPVQYREAIIVCDLQEMTYDEASVILGCAVGTVRSRLHRARNFLIHKLAGKRSKHKTDSRESNGDPYELSTT